MSNFYAISRLKTEDGYRTAVWIDNHFGRGKYGVRFINEDKIYKEELCERREPVLDFEERKLAEDIKFMESNEKEKNNGGNKSGVI